MNLGPGLDSISQAQLQRLGPVPGTRCIHSPASALPASDSVLCQTRLAARPPLHPPRHTSDQAFSSPPPSPRSPPSDLAKLDGWTMVKGNSVGDELFMEQAAEGSSSEWEEEDGE